MPPTPVVIPRRTGEHRVYVYNPSPFHDNVLAMGAY